MNTATAQARSWLAATYHNQVELTEPHPVAQSPQAYLYSCQTLAQPGFPRTPMLTATLAVPVDGRTPFHPATHRPWADLASLAEDPSPRRLSRQAQLTNARGCVLALDCALDGARASALPWHPSHEAPGWWARLGRRFAGDADVSVCSSWDELVAAMKATGPDTRGLVWLRRELGGEEATGHLLYAHNNQGNVVVLDPQQGGLAELETQNVRRITLARFHRVPSVPETLTKPWQRAAPDFHSAKRKAQTWLDEVYSGQVVLTDPRPDDEHERGWLFPVNTRAFLAGRRREDALLDAALVVPKDRQEPFPLPNSNPWQWFTRWSAGETPGAGDLLLPPAPGRIDWLDRVLTDLGGAIRITDHTEWPTVLAELATLPPGVRALVWVRRLTTHNRETTGLLLNAAHTTRGLVLLDPMTGAPAAMETQGVLALHLIRYR
ncbi:YrhB domain-containing protein [Kitasatospora sp. NPDC056138]|uniref:YrhB domain-containing protein n=1 Tax=Kitasatospora sp. NPDC056138 TaxID=3345724 RepID=UPI0035E20480